MPSELVGELNLRIGKFGMGVRTSPWVEGSFGKSPEVV